LLKQEISLSALNVHYALIPHPTRGGFVLARTNGGLDLPASIQPEQSHRSAGVVIDDFRAQYGLELTLLRFLGYTINRETREFRCVLLFEWHNPEMALPETLYLADASEAAQIVSPFAKELTQNRFDEPAAPPDKRSAWMRPGWFAAAASDIRARLTEQGFMLTGPLRQQRSWSLTSMLVQPTSDGDLYVKVTHPMFGPEPEITQMLAQRFPDHIPAVVDSDPTQQIVITRDFQPAIHLAYDPEPAHWETAISTYAGIQRKMEKRVDEIFALGCWDRRPMALHEQIDALLADTAPMLIGHPRWGLTEEEAQRVQAMGPRLKQICVEMDALGIPPALVHGDFHGGNIAMQGSKPIFFDWSDASVGHPFIDLISLLEDGDVLPDADLRGRIEQAYLAAWADSFAPEVLQRALTLAAPLAMLNMAVSYRHIFHHQEEAARIEIPGAEVYWLKKLVETI
jgi:hypothetical protein